MEELFLTTTSKRNLHSTWSLDLEVVDMVKSTLNQHFSNLQESSNAIKQSAESVMLDYHQRLPTAEREHADITVISDQRRSSSAEFIWNIWFNIFSFSEEKDSSRDLTIFLLVLNVMSIRKITADLLLAFD